MKQLINVQAGRSMVEMLAVLAIIGVLSVGSIAAFRRALDAKKTNDLLNDVSIMAASIATRGALVYEETCTTFEEQGYIIPDAFNICTATSNEQGVISIRVTYRASVPERIQRNLADKCSKTMYISPDASIFMIGPHNQKCGEFPQNIDDDNATPCNTASDCGDEAPYECKNHRCKACYPYNNVADLSQACCQMLSPFFYTQFQNGRCAYDTANACESYANTFQTNCACLSDMKIAYRGGNYVSPVFGSICCPASATNQQVCCENMASGNVWCAVNNTCFNSITAGQCARACVPYEQESSYCYCAGPELSITLSPTQSADYCCSINDISPKDCCQKLGFSWNGENAFQGHCQPGQPDICIDVVTTLEIELY